ncbi:PhnD/SsuA/transferrin family substrate-binding protein [Ottowia testudinis]|uniref:PhnD/SsuA/transferrin family substrate-binding protein n=1 Tax=Ottowia testudinis TaxID=2816950 RepID=A0A975CEU3_9BURK|nr:PhnD/SsuA/transferrin family substrate-binding protein [Ottowia testudinis]QTD44532.1 PhnD/SsuA/transferrin family substrate-binding protein [Ottowia testudinis]
MWLQPLVLRGAFKGLIGVAMMAALCAAWGQTTVLINPGDQIEGDRLAVFNNWKNALEASLRTVGVHDVQTRFSSDATADLSASRANTFDVMVAPAPTIGSAVRHGYTPVAGLAGTARAVLVTLADSAIADLAQSQGKRLGMPGQDSVVTYLLRGEVQATNISLRKKYASIYQTRYQDALLHCLEVRRCDVVAVEQNVAQRWVAAGAKVKIVWQSREVPGQSVAVRKDAKLPIDSLRTTLMAELSKVSGERHTGAQSAKDFEYVSSLGYFTPRVLAGATLVEDPAMIESLMSSGARYIDTRTRAEFDKGHVPGAQLVPYVEKSAKEPDYDSAHDQFKLQDLGSDKAQALIFACNGAECWKSFKASHAAIKAGYDKVYWFRTGFPAWRDSGRKVVGEKR